MIQNTCKLRTNNFSCDCCDEHNCQRYIAYQQGRADAINEFVDALVSIDKQRKGLGIDVIDVFEVEEKLKEQDND